MPVYEYRCQQCGEKTEVFHRSFTTGQVSCQQCGSQKMEKLISVPGNVKVGTHKQPGTTCCGREERCDTPACATGEGCRRG